MGMLMISWSLAYVISEWVIRVVMLPVVTRRRSPTAAMAWLLIIFFIPWLGLGVYVLLGGNRLGWRRVKRHAMVRQAMTSVNRLVVRRPDIIQPQVEPAQQQFVHLAEHMGAMPVLGGNDVELIDNTRQAIDRLVDDIDHARHHVHLLYYIFRDDRIGKRVAGALARAERRGVQCRVLVDAVGSRRFVRRMGRWMKQHGVQMHAMLPVNPVRRVLARVDLRNHRKLAIIDGYIAHTGSQNIVNPDYGTKRLVWEDVAVRITGPTALQLQLVYLEDWYFTTDEVLDESGLLPPMVEAGESAVQVMPTGPNHPTEPLLHLVIEAMHAARQQIIITSPYFIPDEASMLAMYLAAKRGVRIDVVLPRRSDHPLVQAAGQAYFDELLDAGIHLHLHSPGLLHAKSITIDDTVSIIGSANFDIRSFFLNFELNVLLYGRPINNKLRQLQKQYISQSQVLSPAQWQRRSYARQVTDDVLKLFSPLL
jgi:cardiolipin synthase